MVDDHRSVCGDQSRNSTLRSSRIGGTVVACLMSARLRAAHRIRNFALRAGFMTTSGCVRKYRRVQTEWLEGGGWLMPADCAQ
jgi:hypothetical protein